MSLPEKLYFMPADADDEPGIEVGDGRVLLLHPYSLDDSNDEETGYVDDLYRAVVHRYNNYDALAEEASQLSALLRPMLKEMQRQNPEGFIRLITAVFKEGDNLEHED